MKEYIEDQLEASEILLEAAEEAKHYTEAFRHQVRIRLLKDLLSEAVNLTVPVVVGSEAKVDCDRCNDKPEAKDNVLCRDCEIDLHGM